MTDEEMIVPQDVQANAKRMAEEDNVPLNIIIKYMKEEYFDPVIVAAFPDPKANNGERARQALLVARSRIASEHGDEDVSYKGIILVKGPVECDISKKGNEYSFRDVHGIFSREDEAPIPVKIRLFGDAIQQIDEVPEKEPIKCNLKEETTDKYGVSLSAAKLFWEKSGKPVDIRTMLTNRFGTKKTVNEMEYSRNEVDEDGNPKRILLECRVKSVYVGVGKDTGYKYLSLGVYSDEDGPDKIAYIRAPLSMAVFDCKSLIWVIGENRKPKDGFEDKTASIWADIIYPIVVFPLSSNKRDSMIANASKKADNISKAKKSNNRVTPEATDVGSIDEIDEGDGWGF